MEKVIEFIKQTMLKKFPTLKIMAEYNNDFDDYFIIVDNEDIYFSKEFASLMTYINFDYLIKKRIINIFIICDPDKFY